MKRKIETYGNYFWTFYNDQTKVVQDKIDYTLEIIISVERVPKKFFKHLEDGIYEVRVEKGSNIYRIFSFFD
ncbi:type II toxin-antitoxin system RelE/ParE family toxin, partial [Portibacter lacus]|uniref:type II toxin-antitoxin system RelE/ParE family toxin n=1 Tax=Portibacter lacus TaxID=1099794 RepID=UPI001F1F9605